MQSHVSGRKHQRAEHDKRCFEGITTRAHHLSWDDVGLAEKDSKGGLPTKPDKKPSAWEHRSTKHSIAVQNESWILEELPAVEGGRAVASPVRPKPREKAAGLPVGNDEVDFVRKLVSIPEEAANQTMSPGSWGCAPARSSNAIASTKNCQTEGQFLSDKQLHDKGEIKALWLKHVCSGNVECCGHCMRVWETTLSSSLWVEPECCSILPHYGVQIEI